MPHKKKVAASYLREFLGGYNNNEPGRLYRKEKKKIDTNKKFQPKNMRDIG
jgi:hypothetical protein